MNDRDTLTAASDQIHLKSPESLAVSVSAEWYPVPRYQQLYFELPQILLVLAVVAASLWINPSGKLHGTHEQLGLAPCPSMQILGIPCPSCGMTTSFAFMSRGNLAQSFQAHYFGPVLYLGMVGYLSLLITFMIRGKRMRMARPAWIPLSLMLGGLAGYLLCWAARLILRHW